ncbi:MAG: leucine-rich repeat domain-containing protein [Candidatus Hodarchaeota archaeon]
MDIKPIKKEHKEFKINDYITLKLERDKTVIYVKNKKFLQCKYLLIDIPIGEFKDFDKVSSIDDVSEKLDHSLEKNINTELLEPEIEFWGHCSNLQAWAENLYDTRLLHSNLAFPLLKKLTDIGDPNAKRVFKDEIVERLMSGSSSVSQYLIQKNYLEYFNSEEIELLMEKFFEQIEMKLKKKFDDILNENDMNSLLDVIKINLDGTKIFLTNEINPVDVINKDTQMGFSYEIDRIISLGFNRCGLKLVPFSIGSLGNLKELYMTENKLNSIPESIGDLINLEKLDLSDNYLINLPNEIGNLINLKELNINHNIIQVLPESILKLKKLKILSIWGNQLIRLPKNMNEMTSLRILGLSFNQLKRFPEFSYNFESLEILDLSNNRIKILPECLEHLKSLKALWLNNNPIETIPESLLSLESLNDLYLVNTPLAIKPDIKTEKIFNDFKKKDVNIWK